MPISLINMRTGESHPIDPERTLVGSGSHADVRLPDGSPFLAAVVVEYPGGWAVHPLTEDPPLTLNGRPLAIGDRAAPRHQDMLAVDGHRFQFEFDEESSHAPKAAARTSPFNITIRGSDGMEEFRVVDHDLLIGRLGLCHVQYAYTTLSRLNVLFSCDGGDWWAVNLAKGPVGRIRPGEEPVRIGRRTTLLHGDELIVGPLHLKIEIPTPAAEPPIGFAEPLLAPPPAAPKKKYRKGDMTDEHVPTDVAVSSFDASPPTEADNVKLGLHLAGVRLDSWLKSQKLQAATEKSSWGILKKLADFWTDTPETTRARGLASTGKLSEAFEVLEKAIRARPENPALLRELYRLYTTAGLGELCYRPLRHIEKLADARGKPDAWVLEELARVCTSLGPTNLSLFDRAIQYWNKLELVTGRSCSREKQDTLGRRALVEGGFAGGTRPASEAP